jgi:archaeal flagellar protein FlaJ
MGDMIYVENDWRYAAYIAAAIIFILFLLVALVVGHYTITSSIVPINVGKTSGHALIIDNLIAIGFLGALAPVAVVAFLNYRYLKSVETNIPRFLRDVLQSTDSGLILPAAILEAAKQDYGPVSFQMGIAMTKFGMGNDFSQSVMEATKRLRHPYAPQVGQIIAEAYSSGGRTHEVLTSSVSLFNDLEQYNQQRESELKPYTQLVYISLGIYLIIAYIIVNNFIGPFIAASTIQGTKTLGNIKVPLGGESYFLSVFYISALLECVFAGLVAGKIVDRSAASGLRHALILIAITIVAFSILGLAIGYKPF